MLHELIIDNLALLKHIHISFKPGMTCLTGETGAGKSIMLDAIGLAMGDRCDPSLVGTTLHNNNEAKVSAEFTINSNNLAYNWLAANNFFTPADNSHSVVITRLLSKNNKNIIKSKAYINNIPASLQQLKQLGQLLIYIHGQHEHLNLLKEQNQLKILDNYGELNQLSQEINNLYKSWTKTNQLLQTKLTEQNQYQAQKQLLEFQISELESANLIPNEWQEINQQYQWLANQENYTQQLNQVNFILEEGDFSTPSVNTQLTQAFNILSNIKSSINNQNKNITDITEYLSQALIQINEASIELRNFLLGLNNDPATMEVLDKRISKLHDLARKYKTNPDNLINLFNQCTNSIKALESQGAEINLLRNNLTNLEQQYQSLANILTTKRQQTAEKLSKKLTALLQKLRMENAELLIKLVPINFNSNSNSNLGSVGPIGPNGNEFCTFLIKTNSDRDFTSLANGASGGELSRVALATQVATAEVEGTPSLIFDEVDVGIGGGTAEIVGQLLRQMGSNTQVMCITHLAQVASQADQHILVSKSIVNNITSTNIEYLNKQERVAELARMIGGLTITKQTVAHAKDLLERAQA